MSPSTTNEQLSPPPGQADAHASEAQQQDHNRQFDSRLAGQWDEDAVLQQVRQRLSRGDDPLQIIEDCNEGMRLVGQRYECGEYFVSGLIMSGEIFREVVELVQPLLQQAKSRSSGTVLVGTVAGDNTLIVLFPDEPALDRWLERFQTIQAPAGPAIAREAAPA